MDKLKKIFNQATRAYIYRVILAGGAVAGFYGIITAEEALVWGGFGATVLMVLPTTNTPVKSNPER